MEYNSKEYKALQKEWYEKLKKDGFKDIETEKGNMDTGKILNNIATRCTVDTFKAQQDYYRFAGQFLHEYKFKSEDRIIWESHCNGVSIREIVKVLKKQGFITYKRRVHETLQRLQKEFRKHKRQDSDDEE